MRAENFAAMVQRSVARDAFDAAVLLSLQSGLLENPEFRLAFVCSVAGGRTDPRDLRPSEHMQDPVAIEQQPVPMLRLEADGSAPDAAELLSWVGEEQKAAVKRLLDWSVAEQRFLDRLHDDGVVDAEALHPDSMIQERIRSQPMLQWKALNVRNFREEKTPDM